jgi:hypothetical protein
MARSETFRIGEQPGTGKYRCVKCGKYVATVLHPAEQLPPCKNCDSAPDVRYEVENHEAAVSHGPELPGR